MITSVALIIACCVLISFYASFIFFIQPKLHGTLQSPPAKNPCILLTCAFDAFGGAASHMVSLYHSLSKNGSFVVLFVRDKTPFQAYLASHAIPHYTTVAGNFMKIRPLYHFIIQYSLHMLCKRHNIDIIQCNDDIELKDARAVRKRRPVKIAYTRHTPSLTTLRRLNNLDAIIGVSNHITTELEKKRQEKVFAAGAIVNIPPLVCVEPFVAYTPKETRAIFFKENFGLIPSSSPIITTVAHFYDYLFHKNHQLLFQAVEILVKEKQKRLTLMLAGTGKTLPYFKEMVCSMGIAPYVHFLGFCSNIPALLHHSDIMVLPSGEEAFPIVFMEAGLMHKPSIGAYQTGAQEMILDKKTGLLFKNNNARDLADKIEYLIDNPEETSLMGQSAYTHVTQHFVPDITVQKYNKLYQQLIH